MIATEKQINFILSLADQKDTTEVHPLVMGCVEDIKMGYPETINRKYASRMIELLLEAPRKRVSQPSNTPDVKSGRYAIEFSGKLRFFHVSRPDSGRWAGYVFVNEQAGDDLFQVRNAKQRNDILEAIANDDDALARYGQELGVCGICNRTLTDEVSRSIGIGPICRNK